MADDIIVRDDQGDLAVNVVTSTEGNVPYNYDDCFTLDTNGRRALRVVGAGGGSGDSHNKGHYATPQALEEAYPTASAGDFATVESTGTIWLWDNDEGEWVDSHKTDAVTSVNGQTGAVVLDAEDVGALPSDTPIPDPQVNSDWNATSGVAEILNKPTIPSTAQQVGAIPQYETMPTASASNVGELAQYSGETIPDVPATAVATQTVGSGLSDLQVNVDTFIGVEQPSGAETVDFTAIVTQDSVIYDPDKVSDPNSYLMTRIPELIGKEGIYIVINAVDENNVATEIQAFNQNGGFFTIIEQDLVDNNVVISNVAVSDTIYLTFVQDSTTWEKDSETVDPATYGISFSGTPSNGDVLTVSYTPFVEGITNGYFYKSSAEYSDPTATISQTTGSGLSDLAVNVETFIEAEQPTQDEQVEFVSAGSVRTMSQTSGESGDISLSITNVEDFLTEIGSLDDVYIGAGSVITKIYASGNGDDRPYQISVEYIVEGTNYVRWDLPADQYSVVVSGTSPAGTLMGPIENATVLSEDSWTKDNESVDIAAYGVSYSGSPTTGDVLTVAYTAPAPIGYSWNQTDVQPSSGGGSAGIEWKTKVDLPAEYAGSMYNAAPYYTIVGGLPDGEYEFYFSTKTMTEREYPIGEVIFKVKMTINNSSPRGAYAQMGYVFDGNYMPDGNNVYGSESHIVWSWVWANGNDLIFYTTQRPWASAILGYNNHQAVPECFKLSAIKNVETGQEYIAVGAINLDGSEPAYTDSYNSSMRLSNIVAPPIIPSYFSNLVWNESDVNSLDGLTINMNASEIYVRAESGGDEFYGVAYRSDTYDYEQEIFIATGKFANWQFARRSGNSNLVVLFGGTPTFTSSIKTFVGATGDIIGVSIGPYMETYYAVSPCNFVKFGKTCKFLTPTANQIGGVVQYIGETDANYTKGYSYTGVGTIITVPDSFTPSDYSLPDFTLTIDDSNFISALVSVTGWSETDIRYMIQQGYSWSIGYNSANSSINSVFWGAYGNFSNDPVTQCFTVTTTQTADVMCDFRITYTPEHKDVQNGHWELLPVQPLDLTGITGYDATKTQVLKNVQGVMTWVDE